MHIKWEGQGVSRASIAHFMLIATSSGVITNDATNSPALCWLTLPDYHVGVRIMRKQFW